MYGTANFISTASSLAAQSVLSLARMKDRLELSPWIQPGLASGSLPLPHPQTAVLKWCRAEIFRDAFVYKGLERRYGHNLQRRWGRIPPRDKYCHKLNPNPEVRTLPSVQIYRIQTGTLFVRSPTFITSSSKCKFAYLSANICLIWSRNKDHR
jgi:hypothetical protein